MVLNNIIEQAAGRQSRTSDHGGMYFTHKHTHLLLALYREIAQFFFKTIINSKIKIINSSSSIIIQPTKTNTQQQKTRFPILFLFIVYFQFYPDQINVSNMFFSLLLLLEAPKIVIPVNYVKPIIYL